MYDGMNMTSDKDFIQSVRTRAQKQLTEYRQILHEIEIMKRRAQKAKEYLDKLNGFLESEGQTPEVLKEPRNNGSPISRPGNRAKDYPVRKAQWLGMTLEDIVQDILKDGHPDNGYHADEIAAKIYDLATDKDLQRVKDSLVVLLRRGTRDGLWEALGKNHFRIKSGAKLQGMLSNV